MKSPHMTFDDDVTKACNMTVIDGQVWKFEHETGLETLVLKSVSEWWESSR